MGMTGAAPPPAERVVTGDGIVDVRINGAVARLRIDPAAPSIALLTPEFVERAGLRVPSKLGIGFGYTVGPTGIMSSTTPAKVDFGAGPQKARVAWTPRPFAAVADGTIGPAALPDPVVRFVLRAPLAGERTTTMRYEQPGFPMTLFGLGWSYATGEIMVGGQPMRIRFDPHHARTLATAGAAARLAAAHDGTMTGVPEPIEIAFGIERPVRTMALARPLTLGALSIDRLGVRIGDDGSVAAIREAGAPIPPVDPDEIVVTASGRKRDVRRDTISVGADLLARCSSIVFDKPARQIRLTCAERHLTTAGL